MNLNKLISNRKKWLSDNSIQDWNESDTINIAEKFADQEVQKYKKEIEWLCKTINQQSKVKAIAFLDSIRNYERENGERICNDERTSEELYDIFEKPIDNEDK